MWDKTKVFISEHPWGAAAAVFVVGLILIWMFHGSKSGGSAKSGSTDLSPYYNAQSAAVTAGADVYGAQIAAQSATAKNTADNQAAVTIAGYQASIDAKRSDNELIAYNNKIQAELDAHLADLSSPYAKDLAAVTADRDVAIQKSSDTASVDIAKAGYTSSLDLAKVSAGTDQAYIDYLAGAVTSNNQTKIALGQQSVDAADSYNKATVAINADKNYTTRYNTAVGATKEEYLSELSGISKAIGTGSYDLTSLAEYSADLRSPIVYNLAYLLPK